MKEAWKPVVDYEGYYEVSNLGRVRSVDRVVRGRLYKSRILKPNWTGNPIGTRYLCVGISKNGVARTTTVHRLVLEAWVGPCPDGCEACHGSGGNTDNSLDNLRWDTHESNCCDRFNDGFDPRLRVKRSDGEEFDSIKEAAKFTGCNNGSISYVCNGKRNRAGGFGWEYIDS